MSEPEDLRIFPDWDGFITHDELARRVFDIPWFWSQVAQAAIAYGRYGTRERARQAMERIALSGLTEEALARGRADRAVRQELVRHVMATWHVGAHD